MATLMPAGDYPFRLEHMTPPTPYPQPEPLGQCCVCGHHITTMSSHAYFGDQRICWECLMTKPTPDRNQSVQAGATITIVNDPPAPKQPICDACNEALPPNHPGYIYACKFLCGHCLAEKRYQEGLDEARPFVLLVGLACGILGGVMAVALMR